MPVHLRTDFQSSCAVFVKYRPAPTYKASKTDLVICFEFYVSMWWLLIYLMLADLYTMEEKPWFSTMIFKRWIGNSFVQTCSKLIWRRVSAISAIFHTHKIWGQMPGSGQKWPSPETNKVKKVLKSYIFSGLFIISVNSRLIKVRLWYFSASVFREVFQKKWSFFFCY